MTLEFCLCGCGKRLTGKQKKFASIACNRRWRFRQERKRELEFCLCGCGTRLTGKQSRFASNACLKRYKRQSTRKSDKLEFCLCGCGKRLTGKQKKFASEACKTRWRMTHLVYPDKYQKKQDLVAALTLAILVFDFEIEGSISPKWTGEIKNAKVVLSKFRDELKSRFGLALLAPKTTGSNGRFMKREATSDLHDFQVS